MRCGTSDGIHDRFGRYTEAHYQDLNVCPHKSSLTHGSNSTSLPEKRRYLLDVDSIQDSRTSWATSSDLRRSRIARSHQYLACCSPHLDKDTQDTAIIIAQMRRVDIGINLGCLSCRPCAHRCEEQWVYVRRREDVCPDPLSLSAYRSGDGGSRRYSQKGTMPTTQA